MSVTASLHPPGPGAAVASQGRPTVRPSRTHPRCARRPLAGWLSVWDQRWVCCLDSLCLSGAPPPAPCGGNPGGRVGRNLGVGGGTLGSSAWLWLLGPNLASTCAEQPVRAQLLLVRAEGAALSLPSGLEASEQLVPGEARVPLQPPGRL